MDFEMNLVDTVQLMNSVDYKERFKAEYYQTSIRYKKLLDMVNKWDNGALTFSPTCPRYIYDLQLDAMHSYLTILEKRAEMEDINL